MTLLWNKNTRNIAIWLNSTQAQCKKDAVALPHLSTFMYVRLLNESFVEVIVAKGTDKITVLLIWSSFHQKTAKAKNIPTSYMLQFILFTNINSKYLK